MSTCARLCMVARVCACLWVFACACSCVRACVCQASKNIYFIFSSKIQPNRELILYRLQALKILCRLQKVKGALKETLRE